MKRLAAALAAGLLAFPAAAAAAPSPVTAWYVYGSSPAELASYAYAHGCDFARSQPGGGLRLMLLDFGAARKLGSGTWSAPQVTTIASKGAASGHPLYPSPARTSMLR